MTSSSDPVYGFVYVSKTGWDGAYKIGRTVRTPEERLGEGNRRPKGLVLYSQPCVDQEEWSWLEKYVHRMLAVCRVPGQVELFRFAPEYLRVVKQLLRDLVGLRRDSLTARHTTPMPPLDCPNGHVGHEQMITMLESMRGGRTLEQWGPRVGRGF